MTDLRITIEGIEGAEVARRLAAALEHPIKGTPQQVEALRAELDKVRHQLHNAGNAAIWSAGVLRGEPVPPRIPGVPISLLETAASEARTKVTEQAREINSRDNQIDQMAADLAKLTSRASIAEAASREKDKELAEFRKANDTAIAILDEVQFSTLIPDDYNNNPLLREIARTQGDTSQAIQMLQGKRAPQLKQTEVNNKLLREVSAVMRALESNSGSDRVRKDLSEAHERICKQNDVIDALQADLRKSQNVVHFVDDEARKVREALGLGKLAQVPEVLAAIEDLRNDSRMLEGTASALRGRLQDSERDAEARAEVIKHLHEEYHALEARKQATQYDLDRANDEIAAAEAEIAKYKPLIEAVRAGAIFASRGTWVEFKGWETSATDGAPTTAIELTGRYLTGDIKCL